MLALEQAYKDQRGYLGNERVRQHIEDTSLVAFVGGVAVGKNYLMEASGFPISRTETTRPKRVDDDPRLYSYSSHREMLDAIEAGELVQYGIATKDGLPTEIYGSRPSDYNLGRTNVSDIWADAVHTLDNKGFKTVRAISILTPKAQWISQLSLRLDGAPFDKVEARLNEARYSIRWALAQHLSRAANHLIVVNGATEGLFENNLRQITDFARNKSVIPLDDAIVNDTAQGMYEAIDTIYSRLSA